MRNFTNNEPSNLISQFPDSIELLGKLSKLYNPTRKSKKVLIKKSKV